MRTLFWILGAAFVIFALLAWIFLSFSIAYIGLFGFGFISLFIGWIAGPEH